MCVIGSAWSRMPNAAKNRKEKKIKKANPAQNKSGRKLLLALYFFFFELTAQWEHFQVDWGVEINNHRWTCLYSNLVLVRKCLIKYFTDPSLSTYNYNITKAITQKEKEGISTRLCLSPKTHPITSTRFDSLLILLEPSDQILPTPHFLPVFILSICVF